MILREHEKEIQNLNQEHHNQLNSLRATQDKTKLFPVPLTKAPSSYLGFDPDNDEQNTDPGRPSSQEKLDSEYLVQIKAIKKNHFIELSQFKKLMADLKASYDEREEAYRRKLVKVKAECEIRVQELEDELESLNRQIKIFKSIQVK